MWGCQVRQTCPTRVLRKVPLLCWSCGCAYTRSPHTLNSSWHAWVMSSGGGTFQRTLVGQLCHPHTTGFNVTINGRRWTLQSQSRHLNVGLWSLRGPVWRGVMLSSGTSTFTTILLLGDTGWYIYRAWNNPLCTKHQIKKAWSGFLEGKWEMSPLHWWKSTHYIQISCLLIAITTHTSALLLELTT